MEYDRSVFKHWQERHRKKSIMTHFLYGYYVDVCITTKVVTNLGHA